MAPSVDLIRFKKYALILVVLSLCLQLPTLFHFLTVATPLQKTIYGGIEMLLVFLLLINSWNIWRELKRKSSNQSTSQIWIIQIAKLCCMSLALCVLGDFINRNFFDFYYQHGSNIEHTYLADSIWFFFPGYSCFIYAAYLAARRKNVAHNFIGYTIMIFSVIGVISFVGMYKEGAGAYVATMTGTYAVLISIMLASALWLLKAYGWAIKWVALGAILAPAADALIGSFWIYGDGYFPRIGYLNWIVYFSSQALIQQLPVRLYTESSE